MSNRLSVNYFVAPASIARPGNDFWIDYLEDILADLTREDVSDVYENHTAYPLTDHIPSGGRSAVLTWLNEQVTALRHANRHVDIIYPTGLTVNGDIGAMVLASNEGIDNASGQATAFAMLAWLANERQCQDRQDQAA